MTPFERGFLDELRKLSSASTGKIYTEIEFADDGSIVHFPPNDEASAADHPTDPVTDASVLGKMRPQKDS
jgi:hypothetical protein